MSAELVSIAGPLLLLVALTYIKGRWDGAHCARRRREIRAQGLVARRGKHCIRI